MKYAIDCNFSIKQEQKAATSNSTAWTTFTPATTPPSTTTTPAISSTPKPPTTLPAASALSTTLSTNISHSVSATTLTTTGTQKHSTTEPPNPSLYKDTRSQSALTSGKTLSPQPLTQLLLCAYFVLYTTFLMIVTFDINV